MHSFSAGIEDLLVNADDDMGMGGGGVGGDEEIRQLLHEAHQTFKSDTLFAAEVRTSA